MRTPRLTFRRPVPDLAREVAYLGNIVAGEILPYPGKRHCASWIIHLPDAQRKCGPATSFDVARIRIKEHVEDWLMRADVIDVGAAIDIAVETSKDKAIA